jgi:hypothetical protein
MDSIPDTERQFSGAFGINRQWDFLVWIRYT